MLLGFTFSCPQIVDVYVTIELCYELIVIIQFKMTSSASFSASVQRPRVTNRKFRKLFLNKLVKKLQHVFPLLFSVVVNDIHKTFSDIIQFYRFPFNSMAAASWN